ncbi:MAG TPA: DUF4082 domain-containing protein [Chitinophagaceae bacterium]|nr:DUF4082 domain-containing protein [Chitinophagaceae bacterium]
MKRNIYLSFASIKRFAFFFVLVFAAFSMTASAQTFTVFSPSDVPTGESKDGPGGIEVGFKFKVTQIGTISAIRFYKNSGLSTGSFTVNLWTNGNSGTPGTLMATATNPNVTAVEWIEIPITNKVLLPGNVYVVSVFSPTGWYSFSNNYFPTTPDQFEPPFIIVSNNNDPAGVGNGVYTYTNSTTFPTNSGVAANYWVDLKFTTAFTLPVSLTDFKATPANNDVSLSWKTEYEYYNKGFEVQRSNNGNEWYALSFVDGVNESSATRNYSYADKALAPGTYYYRLKQVDRDGKINYSAVVSATIGGKGKVALYPGSPNPFSATTSIRFDLPRPQHARLSVLDLNGREVKVLVDRNGPAGSHLVTLSADNLPPQMYIVRLQTEDGILTQKVMVK